jgi:uncharacterized protein involved in exopolysaccharide biosynthesis
VLEQLPRTLRRQRLLTGSVFGLTVLAAYAALSVMTEMYEARATVVVSIEREGGYPLASEVQILRSRELLSDVVNAAGPLAFNPAPGNPDRLLGQARLSARRGLAWVYGQYNEALIALDLRKRLNERDRTLALLESALVVEPEGDTGVIGLRLRLPDAALAVKLQSILLDRYQTRRGLVRQRPRTAGSVERDTVNLREVLVRAEEDLNRARQDAASGSGITAEDAVVAARLSELEEKRRLAEQTYLASLTQPRDADTANRSDQPRIFATIPAASLEPVYPPKLLIMALAVVAGVLLGGVAAALREWTSDAVHDASSLEVATGLVCFGSFTDRRAVDG